MGFIDLILIVIIGAFVIFGLFFGLIHTIGSLVGTLFGILIASHLVNPFTHTLSFLFGNSGLAKVIVFIVLFVIASRLIGLLFLMFEKVFHMVSFIPFVKSINRLLGGFFGFIEGVIVVGIILFYAMQVLPDDTLLLALESSAVAEYLVAAVSVFKVLFPDSLGMIETTV
jgi:membrane protein required for colicin V production